jgi:RNA polymerase sigma factor (sigma-70 family)
MKEPFEGIVSRHGVTVLRVCRAVVGVVDADDAWSETFLSALEAYPRLPDDANVEAWLVTIAHRKAIDITRRAARRAEPVADVPIRELEIDLDGELDLSRSLAELSEKQRYAVIYHHIVGLPYSDIAAILGGTPEAARRAAADGVNKLRKGRIS